MVGLIFSIVNSGPNDSEFTIIAKQSQSWTKTLNFPQLRVFLNRVIIRSNIDSTKYWLWLVQSAVTAATIWYSYASSDPWLHHHQVPVMDDEKNKNFSYLLQGSFSYLGPKSIFNIKTWTGSNCCYRHCSCWLWGFKIVWKKFWIKI